MGTADKLTMFIVCGNDTPQFIHLTEADAKDEATKQAAISKEKYDKYGERKVWWHYKEVEVSPLLLTALALHLHRRVEQLQLAKYVNADVELAQLTSAIFESLKEAQQ